MKWIAFIAFLATCKIGFSQRPHLEVGATLGFKDDFHWKPEFDPNSKYTEFHMYDVYFFSRVSRNKIGGEFGLGFEKAGNYFVRYQDNSTELNYVNFNRISIELSPLIYLIKSSEKKLDFQLGLRNYFNLNSQISVPQQIDLKRWKLAGRATINYTYRSFLVGIFYERDLRSDYSFRFKGVTFGIRGGVLF